MLNLKYGPDKGLFMFINKSLLIKSLYRISTDLCCSVPELDYLYFDICYQYYFLHISNHDIIQELLYRKSFLMEYQW